MRSSWLVVMMTMVLYVFGGCGGGGSSGSSATLSGVFLDAAVKGVRYETPSQEGMTDVNGQ